MTDPKTDQTDPHAGASGATEGAPPEEVYRHVPRFSLLPPELPDLTDPDSPDFLAAKAAFNGPEPEPTPHAADVSRPRPHRLPRHRRHRRGGFWLVPSLIFLCLGLLFAGLALSGKPIRLPVWAVAEAEARLNQAFQAFGGSATEGIAMSLGAAEVVVDDDWVPRVRLEDVRLLSREGVTLLSLPETRVALDPAALAQGKVRLRSLRLIGASMSVRRLENGQLDLPLGQGMAPRPVTGLSGMIASLLALFDHPALSALRRVEGQALTLKVDDRMLGRDWDLGDGRLQLTNDAGALALEMGVSVMGGSSVAQAVATLIAAKTDASARLTVTVDHVAAADIAAQAAPLAWLAVLDAPISGQIASALDAAGKLSMLEASLTLNKGALRPTPQIDPVAFDGASLFFSYDPLRERLDLREGSLQSREVTLRASGHAYLPGVNKGVPQEVLAQLQIDRLQIDPKGILEEPVAFQQGALDLRVRLKPFGVDVGQLSLTHDGQRLHASGRVDARPDGWAVALNAELDQIARDRLLALWPAQAVAKTRLWVAENVQDGLLSNVRAGFRAAPGREPVFSLGYDYSGADVRFLKTLPPIRNGRGYAVIEGKSYTSVLEAGQVTAKSGGALDIAGTVFSVGDVTQKPARAEISVKAKGSLTAALSVLDEPPFGFLTKANLPVTLGEGEVEVAAQIAMPLRKGVKLPDVSFDVTGRISAFQSERLVPGRMLTADGLTVKVTPQGMEIAGKGALQGVPFEGHFDKKFGPEFKGRSSVAGQAELSVEAARKLGVTLPEGLISGRGSAAFQIALKAGERPALTLTSTLGGVGMAIPALGWSKPARDTGSLALDITLGKPASVDRLRLSAAGLNAVGSISLTPEGGMDLARFTSVKLGSWLDAQAELRGRGKGVAPAISVTGGAVDLRGLAGRDGQGGGGAAGAAGGGAPVALALDRLTVTQGLSLTGFRSVITPGGGGVSGDFSGRVNGQVSIVGSLAPTPNGTAIRILSDDAGAVFSAARIFPNAQGGLMELALRPTGAKGTYDGTVRMSNIRIRKAPALAELINAVSVVGLLEQMNGSGLLFGEADAEFRLSPRAVQIARGSAVGASLGVSLSGLYVLDGGRLDLQGVVSPIYLLNGIGAIFTRKGEGLFGFNYHITGTAKTPDVSVNPLSILTPGMFREIFRAAPPKLEPTE